MLSKKRKSQSYILILSTIIMISLTISVSWFRDIESRRIEGERFLFPELGTPTDESSLKMLNNIVTLKIESIKGEFYINKSQEKWTLPSLANFPVSIDTFLPSESFLLTFIGLIILYKIY